MSKKTWKYVGYVGVFVAALVALKFLPLRDWLEPVWNFIEDSGPWGYVYFFLIGTAISLLMLPISPVIIASGLLFGFWQGLGISCLILLASSAIGFLLGDVFWQRIKDYEIFQNKWFKAIRKAIETEGEYLVGLLRLTPFIHYTVGNLFYGSLDLKFWRFLIASILGMIPGTSLMVYAGYLAQRSFSEDVEFSIWHVVLFAAGIIIFVFITWLVTKKTRRILDEGTVD